MKTTFSVNDYDADGDIVSDGIFLHFQSARIKVAKDITEYDDFIRHLESMRKEILANLQET